MQNTWYALDCRRGKGTVSEDVNLPLDPLSTPDAQSKSRRLFPGGMDNLSEMSPLLSLSIFINKIEVWSELI